MWKTLFEAVGLTESVSELAELWTVGEERNSVTSNLSNFAEVHEGEVFFLQAIDGNGGRKAMCKA